MKIVSLVKNIVLNDQKPAVNVLLETSSSKEIRIAFKQGQLMKEHKAPFPITVLVFSGQINFGVNGVKHQLSAGSLIALGENVLHDLTALEDSVVLLSISKYDKIERVKSVDTA